MIRLCSKKVKKSSFFRMGKRMERGINPFVWIRLSRDRRHKGNIASITAF